MMSEKIFQAEKNIFEVNNKNAKLYVVFMPFLLASNYFPPYSNLVCFFCC